MKILMTFGIVLLSTIVYSQQVETTVDSNGVKLVDQQNVERIVLDAISNKIELKINDSLILSIQGGTTTSFKLINANTLIETGIEMDQNGAFAVGEFNAPSLFGLQLKQVVQIVRNGLYRPAPDTQSLATANQERLRITSNGFVGVGTSNPTVILDVNGGVRIRQLEPEPFPLTKVLMIDDFGIIFTREMPPFSEEPNNYIRLIEKQNKVISELTERIAGLEKKMKN